MLFDSIFGNAVLFIAIAVTLILLIRWTYRYRNRYVGVGWILTFDEKNDPQVRVRTFLLDSPAGRTGVRRGSVLLSRNGQQLDFKTNADYLAWWDSLPETKLGDVIRYELSEETGSEEPRIREVVLVAETIQGPIPVYNHISDAERYDLEDRLDCRIHTGLRRCPRTGVWHETMSLRFN